MLDLVIRDIREPELEVVRGILAEANEQFRGALPDANFRPYLASAMDVEGRLQNGEVIVAELAGRIVGTITFYVDAAVEGTPAAFSRLTAGLRATAVHPDARGLGVGGRLVDECLARARSHGARSLALHTASFMTAAIALYTRAGFVRAPFLDFPATEFFGGDPRPEFLAMGFVLDL